MNEEHLHLGSIVIICDIVDFSKKHPLGQVNCVAKLWDVLWKSPLFATDKKKEVLYTGTGDGLLLAFPNQRKTVTPQEVIGLAEYLIAQMSKGDPAAQLRIGIHTGVFRSVKVSGLKQQQIVGTAANDCARISGIGDGDHIVCSDLFVSLWKDTEDVPVNYFYPDLNEPALEFYVKHDIPMAVRAYTGGKSLKPPRRLVNLEAVMAGIMGVLKDIEGTLRQTLGSFDSDLSDRQKLSARVSILVPQLIGEEKCLCPTRFRYHFDKAGELPGKTKYSLSGSGIGVPGRAFNLRKPLAINGLADPDAHIEVYAASLQDFGLDQSKIKSWQRKSRTLLSFPFGLFNFDAAEPDGVICIDATDPCEKCNKGNLEEVLGNFMTQKSLLLSGLWRLRIVS